MRKKFPIPGFADVTSKHNFFYNLLKNEENDMKHAKLQNCLKSVHFIFTFTRGKIIYYYFFYIYVKSNATKIFQLLGMP